MSVKFHHWDFVDEDGCLHCNCNIGVIEPQPGSVGMPNTTTSREALIRRIVRLEAIVAKLCEDASRGQGSMGKHYWEFAGQINDEHGS